MYSLISPLLRNEKVGWYETFRSHMYAINSQKYSVLLIDDSMNSSKFSSIFCIL